MKSKENKLQIKQFRDGSSHFWVGNKVYHLNKQNEIEFICGGEKDEKEVEELKSFCKRNRKTFKEREQSIFESEPKEWSELTFGKHKGEKLDTVEPKYLKWLYKETADKKLKNEIKELLKIK